MGKELKKKKKRVYVLTGHFAIYLKLAHYKSIIFQ